MEPTCMGRRASNRPPDPIRVPVTSRGVRYCTSVAALPRKPSQHRAGSTPLYVPFHTADECDPCPSCGRLYLSHQRRRPGGDDAELSPRPTLGRHPPVARVPLSHAEQLRRDVGVDIGSSLCHLDAAASVVAEDSVGDPFLIIDESILDAVTILVVDGLVYVAPRATGVTLFHLLLQKPECLCSRTHHQHFRGCAIVRIRQHPTRRAPHIRPVFSSESEASQGCERKRRRVHHHYHEHSPKP
mmetsp:Transcript_23421/g.58052  ORF Transcript_23421/g.58052 Transcript_23421/m.58052 type:complete len:242 (+) Transcript_23421:550-1275(+)